MSKLFSIFLRGPQGERKQVPLGPHLALQRRASSGEGSQAQGRGSLPGGRGVRAGEFASQALLPQCTCHRPLDLWKRQLGRTGTARGVWAGQAHPGDSPSPRHTGTGAVLQTRRLKLKTQKGRAAGAGKRTQNPSRRRAEASWLGGFLSQMRTSEQGFGVMTCHGRSCRPLVLSAVLMGVKKGCLHLWVRKPPLTCPWKMTRLPASSPRSENLRTDLWQQANVDTGVRSEVTETPNQAINTNTGSRVVRPQQRQS